MEYIIKALKKISDYRTVFKVWTQERDPLGRLIDWIDRTTDKIKKFFGWKFCHLFPSISPIYYSGFFVYLENISTCLKSSLFSLQFFLRGVQTIFNLINRSSLNRLGKFFLRLLLVFVLFVLVSYLLYYKFAPFVTFLLSEFFYMLRNFKNPFKGKEPASCMQRHEKKNENGVNDMYKTTNDTYGNFHKQFLKGAKKPLNKQWAAIQNVQNNTVPRRLSPDQEIELLHHRINESNVLDVSWKDDNPQVYAKNQLAVNTVKGLFKTPTTYAALGAFSAANPKTRRNPIVHAGFGGSTYYTYSGMEYAYDKQTTAAGVAISKHQGLEVKGGCLVPGPDENIK